MNEFDRENIEFLMNCGAFEFKRFMEEMDEDTLLYTLDLIRRAKAELLLEELELMEVGGVEDFTEAKAVLSRFTLKG
jgi:hypothetical protein